MKSPSRKTSVKTRKPASPARGGTRPGLTAATAPTTSPAWHKASPIALKTNASIDDAVVTIATACRDHWQDNLPAALAGEHPEGIHQVRVGFRRFRVLLTLLGEQLPEDQRAWLKTETAAFGDALGPVRDLDVFLTELMAPLVEKAAHDSDVAVLLRAVRDARKSAHGDAVAALTSARYRRFMARLQTWLDGRGWQNRGHKRSIPAEEFARAEINRRLEKIIQRTKSIKNLRPAKLHRLRIAIKKLRYGLEFFHAVLPPKRSTRTAHHLKALQDSLGYVNDLDVAKRTVAMLSERAADAKVRAAIIEGGKRLTAAFDHAGKSALPRASRSAARLRADKAL